MMPRKKRRTIIIASVILVILILVICFTLIYLNTDMFKSNKTLFAKYIGQNIQNTERVLNDFGKTQYDELLSQSKYLSNTQIKVKNIENTGTSNENSDNYINKLSININGQTDKINGYDYKDIKLFEDNKEIFNVEYLQKDNSYGIKFPDLFKQYILVENSNLKELFKNLGYTDEEIKNVPEQIDFNNLFTNPIKFSDEEKQILQKKYIDILKEISNDNFSKQDNQNITVNNEQINVNSYVLTLTREQLNSVYIKLLETIKQDEIILSKLDNIQNMIKISNNSTNVREEFTKSIDDTINEINRSNIGQDETKLIVYQNRKNTVRTAIQTPEYEIDFDCLTTDNNKFMQLNIKYNTEEEKSQSITLKNNGKDISVNLSEINDKVTKKTSFNQSSKIDNNNYNKTIAIAYEDNNKSVETNIIQDINIVEEFDNKTIELDDENSIYLNKLTSEKAKSTLNIVSQSVEQKLNEIFTTERKENLLQVLKNANIIPEEQKIEGVGTTETQRNRFNAQFEILQGENLDSNKMNTLIEATKNDISSIEVTSKTQFKLKIDNNSRNEQVETTLKKFIEDNKNEKYNVKVEYDEETGLAKYMVIDIVVNE